MYSINDFRSYELYHHGILGQKWGVRRYQNSDGTLTEEGKKRYSGRDTTPDKVITFDANKMLEESKFAKMVKSMPPMSDAQIAIEELSHGKDKFGDPRKRIEAVTADCELARIDSKRYMSDKEYRKRVDEVADLGLVALEKLRGPGYIEKTDNPKEQASNREWFLFEDQTIGMAMIADLANKGYFASDIEKMSKIVNDNVESLPYPKSGLSSKADAAAFNFREFSGSSRDLKMFATYCSNEKNKDVIDEMLKALDLYTEELNYKKS